MMTGDHPDTAKAIAKYVGIITDHDDNDSSNKFRIAVTFSGIVVGTIIIIVFPVTRYVTGAAGPADQKVSGNCVR